MSLSNSYLKVDLHILNKNAKKNQSIKSKLIIAMINVFRRTHICFITSPKICPTILAKLSMCNILLVAESKMVSKKLVTFI